MKLKGFPNKPNFITAFTEKKKNISEESIKQLIVLPYRMFSGVL
jgi:hypothetical protein